MNNFDLIHFIASIQIWVIVKILFSFALLLYVVFAFVILKQVRLMTETINQGEFLLKAIATIHLLAAVFVFVLAILIL